MARTWLLGAVSMVTIAAGATDATPASTPAARGQELFVRSWIAEDPQAGEDGLGPYFNAESCVMVTTCAPAVYTDKAFTLNKARSLGQA